MSITIATALQRADEVHARTEWSVAVREAHQMSVLQSAMNRAGRTAVEHTSPSNPIRVAIDSGAKGNNMNIAQMMGLVGVQTIEGARPPCEAMFDEHGVERVRTLPEFPVNDTRALARGFVRHSYTEGLTPGETFFHAMAGRDGLVDTAVKTASTGYMQRCLIKALESASVTYDTTVRLVDGSIIQFAHGGSGFDPARVRFVWFRFLDASDEWIKSSWMFSASTARGRDATATRAAATEEGVLVFRVRDWLRRVRIRDGTDMDAPFPLPIDVSAMLKRSTAHVPDSAPLASVRDVVDARARLLETRVFGGVRDATLERSVFDGVASTFILRAYVATHMTLRAVVHDYALTKPQLEWFVRETHRTVAHAIAAAGEAVGAVGACSIGEPTTQMTLNTFHYAGVSAMNVTVGFPRLKELVGAKDTSTTGVTTVFFRGAVARSERLVHAFETNIPMLGLRDVVAQTAVVFVGDRDDAIDAPLPHSSHADAVRLDGLVDARTRSERARDWDWALQLKLGKTRLLRAEHGVTHVADAIFSLMSDVARVYNTQNNDTDWVVWVRLFKSPMTNKALKRSCKSVSAVHGDQRATVEILCDALLETVVVNRSGKIRAATAREQWRTHVDTKSGSLVRDKEWVLDLQGEALERVARVPLANWTRCYSNNVREVERVLGIEAAQLVLERELSKTLGFGGTYIHHAHTQILASVMTQSGSVCATTRHDMEELGGSLLLRASFEEPMFELTEAATFALDDELRGVTERVLVGQRIPLGTGVCAVYMREQDKPYWAPPDTFFVAPIETTRHDDEIDEFVGVRIPALHGFENDSTHAVAASSTVSTVVTSSSSLSARLTSGQLLFARPKASQLEPRLRVAPLESLESLETGDDEESPDTQLTGKTPARRKSGGTIDVVTAGWAPRVVTLPVHANIAEAVVSVNHVTERVRAALPSVLELEVRLGHIRGQRRDARGVHADFSSGVSRELFEEVEARLDSFRGWDTIPGDWRQTLDAFYPLANGDVARTTVEYDMAERGVLAKTHIRKERLVNVDLVAEGMPWDVRVSLSSEQEVPLAAVPQWTDTSAVRIKQRRRFHLQPWVYEITRVWSGKTLSEAEAHQHDPSQIPSYEIEIELLDPATCFRGVPRAAHTTVLVTANLLARVLQVTERAPRLHIVT